MRHSAPVRRVRAETILSDVLVSGTVGSVASALVAMAMARSEGRAPMQPLNATSHWLHGARAGRVRDLDAAHSAVGIGTHYLSALFWAVPYSLWLARAERSGGEILGGAAATAAVAAAVDYLAMPKRLTPGWELAISARGVGATFVALALGLAGGALLVRSSRQMEQAAAAPLTSLPGRQAPRAVTKTTAAERKGERQQTGGDDTAKRELA